MADDSEILPIELDLGQTIDRAMRERLRVRIEYRSPRQDAGKPETIVRTVLPQAWVKRDHGYSGDNGKHDWYFVAWCELRQDHRTFMLGRAKLKRFNDTAAAQTATSGPSMWIDHPPAGFIFAASPYPRPNEVEWKDVAADAIREGRSAMALNTLAWEDNANFWETIADMRAGKHGAACQPKNVKDRAFADACHIGLLRAALQDAVKSVEAWMSRAGVQREITTTEIEGWKKLIKEAPELPLIHAPQAELANVLAMTVDFLARVSQGTLDKSDGRVRQLITDVRVRLGLMP